MNNRLKDLEYSLKQDKDLNDAQFKKRLEERRKGKKQKIFEALKFTHEEETKLILEHASPSQSGSQFAVL